MKTIASNWNNWYGGGGSSVRSDSSRTDNDTVMENSFLLACERAVVTFLKTVRLYLKSYRLVRLDEHFVSVDQSFYWRRSLVWSHDNGGLLKSHLTQKYSSTTLLATLLLSAEVSVLFSPSDVLEVVRTEALNENGLSFGIVLVMLLDIVATLGTILATFTAWGTVGAVSDRNIHAITRSAIGLYATQLPTTLLMFSFYLFCAWVTMLLYKLVPNKFAIFITALLVFMTWHIVSTFSIFGRIILHSNAMSEIAIFPREEEEEMMPVPLFENLLEKTKENLDIPIAIQYRRNLKRALKKGDDWTVIQRHNESRRNIRSVHKRRHTIALPGDGTETFKTQSKDEENEHCAEPTFVDLPQSLRKIGGNITQVSSDFTVLTGLTRGSGDETGAGIDVIDPDVDGSSMKSFDSASPLTLDSSVHNTTKQL